MDSELKNYKDYRIALTGAGGSGKTTLTSAWSEEVGCPIIRADTRRYMPEGVNNHLDVLKLATSSPNDGVEFQTNLIKSRYNLFKSIVGGFISDRAVIDSFVYYALHNSMFSTNTQSDYLYSLTIDSVEYTDLIVHVQPNLSKIGVSNNGVRVDNTAYYSAVSNVIYNVLMSIYNTHGIQEIGNFNISKNLALTVIVSSNSAAAIFDESQCNTGFASNAERIKAIKVALDFVKLVRENV